MEMSTTTTTQQQFKRLLEDIYMKIHESERIHTDEIMKDIQNQLIIIFKLPNQLND
ncbi:hypothetical protein [Bacillus sp. FJAT-50079]|uniref:hypothetical protein n=1 Tax=Bacillus sp. FJAT-50079 TaxID=2833577 RepID=UPI001BC93AC8|nr:hypothetical protein [Bacillus sp. FJAT-50079]MBS4209158.1 hypothetical protein [Bacillus sp. FJAT-50079]